MGGDARASLGWASVQKDTWIAAPNPSFSVRAFAGLAKPVQGETPHDHDDHRHEHDDRFGDAEVVGLVGLLGLDLVRGRRA